MATHRLRSAIVRATGRLRARRSGLSSTSAYSCAAASVWTGMRENLDGAKHFMSMRLMVRNHQRGKEVLFLQLSISDTIAMVESLAGFRLASGMSSYLSLLGGTVTLQGTPQGEEASKQGGTACTEAGSEVTMCSTDVWKGVYCRCTVVASLPPLL